MLGFGILINSFFVIEGSLKVSEKVTISKYLELVLE